MRLPLFSLPLFSPSPPRAEALFPSPLARLAFRFSSRQALNSSLLSSILLLDRLVPLPLLLNNLHLRDPSLLPSSLRPSSLSRPSHPRRLASSPPLRLSRPYFRLRPPYALHPRTKELGRSLGEQEEQEGKGGKEGACGYEFEELVDDGIGHVCWCYGGDILGEGGEGRDVGRGGVGSAVERYLLGEFGDGFGERGEEA